MKFIKPILYIIPAFDKNIGTTIKFSWQGNVPFSNTLIIRNNDTQAIVYQKTIESRRLDHTINANSSLVNGVLYNVSVMIKDINDVVSEWSNKELVYCYSTPTFGINITQGQVISTQTYGVNIAYSQTEGELLQSFRILVHNSNNVLIYDSNVRYDISTVSIANLQDNSSYTIIATGETICGMQLSTGYISFISDFIKAEAYFVCHVENMHDKGSIYIKSNIVSIEGYSDDDINYVNGTVANLNDNKVYFDKDFTIDGDFLLLIKGYGYEFDVPILELESSLGNLLLYYRQYNTTQAYFELIVSHYSSTIQYYINTSLINILDVNTISSVWIRRTNALFDLGVIS